MVTADARLTRSLAAALGVAELSIFLGPPFLRVPGGLLLGLVLPGLVLAPLLSLRGADRVEKLLFVPALSVVIAIVTGLVVSAAHVRLTMQSWAVALGVVTAMGLVVAATGGRNQHGLLHGASFVSRHLRRALPW